LRFRYALAPPGQRKLLPIAHPQRNSPPTSRRPPPTHDVTALLRAWTGGSPGALNDLLPLVYDELRRLAKRYMARERVDHTLQPTALINEAYLRLIDLRRVRWQDRAHFFAMAARVMRRVLVDAARSRRYQKRGGGAPKVSLADALALPAERPVDFVRLDDALEALAAVDPRKAHVVELRFFGGLTVEEAAHAQGVSVDTVMRDWKLAKAWLTREMRKETGARDRP